MLEYQIIEDMKRDRVLLWAPTGNYHWSVLLVNFFAALVALFSLMTLVSVLYVNAKLWIRKEKKGRLFEVLTTTENYAPILLFLSCLALYLSFVPFGRNYAYYMTTKAYFTSFDPDFLGQMYPAPAGIFFPEADLGLPNPFQDYVPYALSGIVLLTAVMALPRLRRPRIEAASPEEALSLRLRQVNTAIYLLMAVTAAVVVATLPPWEASLALEGLVALLVWGVLQASSSYSMKSQTPERNTRRARITEVGAYLLLLIMAVAPGILVPWGMPEQGWGMPLLVALPVVVAGAVGAARMRFRRLTLALFVLITLTTSIIPMYLAHPEIPQAPLKKS